MQVLAHARKLLVMNATMVATVVPLERIGISEWSRDVHQMSLDGGNLDITQVNPRRLADFRRSLPTWRVLFPGAVGYPDDATRDGRLAHGPRDGDLRDAHVGVGPLHSFIRDLPHDD